MIKEHLALPFLTRFLAVETIVEKMGLNRDDQIPAVAGKKDESNRELKFSIFPCPSRSRRARKGSWQTAIGASDSKERMSIFKMIDRTLTDACIETSPGTDCEADVQMYIVGAPLTVASNRISCENRRRPSRFHQMRAEERPTRRRAVAVSLTQARGWIELGGLSGHRA
jgi:hypothetical protein